MSAIKSMLGQSSSRKSHTTATRLAPIELSVGRRGEQSDDFEVSHLSDFSDAKNQT